MIRKPLNSVSESKDFFIIIFLYPLLYKDQI